MSMTLEEAIKYFTNATADKSVLSVAMSMGDPKVLDMVSRVYEANELAMAALREKEERENRGWIPVTEQLPTTDGRFMVTIKGRSGKPHVEMRNFHAGAQKWESQYGWCQENILAWQARPRPYGYKPKEE